MYFIVENELTLKVTELNKYMSVKLHPCYMSGQIMKLDVGSIPSQT